MFETFINKASTDSIVNMSLAQDFENIQKLQLTLDELNLQKIVKSIAKAKNIYLVGIGVSEILVDNLSSFLEALEKSTFSLKSFGVSKKAELINFSRQDVVICFSFQRILKEVEEVALLAKKQGALTIAITDSETNPLAIATNLTMVAPVSGTTFGMSLVAPLALVNILANSYAALDKEVSLKKIKNIKKAWDEFPIFCHGPQ